MALFITVPVYSPDDSSSLTGEATIKAGEITAIELNERYYYDKSKEDDRGRVELKIHTDCNSYDLVTDKVTYEQIISTLEKEGIITNRIELV